MGHQYKVVKMHCTEQPVSDQLELHAFKSFHQAFFTRPSLPLAELGQSSKLWLLSGFHLYAYSVPASRAAVAKRQFSSLLELFPLLTPVA
jgi:hypothetical protein